jgi:hypothetical protein
MHWNDTNANLARVDALIAPTTIPYPPAELKFTAVGWQPFWRHGGFAVTVQRLKNRMLDTGRSERKWLPPRTCWMRNSENWTTSLKANRHWLMAMSMNRQVHFAMPRLETRGSWAPCLCRVNLWRLRAIGWRISWAKLTQGQMPFAFLRAAAAVHKTAAALFVPAIMWARLQFCRPLREVRVH